MLDAGKVKAALEALKNGDADAAMSLLEDMIVAAASGEEAPADDGLSTDDEALAEDPEEPAEEELPAVAASRFEKIEKSIAALTGLVEKATATLTAIGTERAASEDAERRTLVGELVKLGAEIPGTAWEGEGDKRKPAAHLAAEPIASLRKRVSALRAAKPAAKKREHEAPTAAEGTSKLSASAKAYCAKHGITEAEFLARKASATKRNTKSTDEGAE